jgi:cytochrome c
MKVCKLIHVVGGLAVAMSLSMAQAADAVPELAKTKECMSCHAVDKDMAKAPSFRNIAKKYNGMANVETMLVQKVQAGGVGHWGPNPMPGPGARVQVSDDEAKALVAWVLSQK